MSLKDLNQLDKTDETNLSEEGEIEYYYDWHPTKEDLMSESDVHLTLLRYLMSVLEWLFRLEGWYIGGNINVYQTANKKEYPLSPDVAVFRTVLSPTEKRRLRSWKMVLPNRPAPSVVFEISSKDNWEEDFDVTKKPAAYGRMGVKEYFTYDPNDPPVWSKPRNPQRLRLFGWRYVNGQPVSIQPDERGWLWSEELQSYLGEDEAYLRLYDRQGNRRLNQTEAAWAKLREFGFDPEKL